MARAKEPWRLWYSRRDWRRRRALKLAKDPLCEPCLAEGKHTPATICDHRVPHHGDFSAFIHGELVSMCERHHAPKWADDKRGYSTAIGLDGRPLDPKHPANAERGPLKPLPADDLACLSSEIEDQAVVSEPQHRLPRHLADMLARQQRHRRNE
jgi:hypothetical protein